MAWKKSSPELAERFANALPEDPALERRTMFGYPCAFVHGNMVTGLHEDRMIVRLPAAERAELVGLGGTIFSPMPGRTMKEYVVVPAAVLGNTTALRAWVLKAFRYGASLPAKAPKGRAPAGRKAASSEAPAKDAAGRRAPTHAASRSSVARGATKSSSPCQKSDKRKVGKAGKPTARKTATKAPREP